MSSISAASTTSSPLAIEVITALTTTFTPPAKCTESASMFDMLSAPEYYVWANEPIPVPASTITSCYPSEFIAQYRTAFSYSSVVPAMSPLICPLNWGTVMTAPGNYIACCPPNYSANNPSTTVDAYRPFYGGTCYSDLTDGQVLTVTQYNNASASVTKPWTVTTTNAQVYAHPIDGYALQAQQTVFVTASNGATTLSTSTSSPAFATNEASSSSSRLSGGAIAGVVIGVIAGLVLLAALIWFLLRRNRKSNTSSSAELSAEKSGGADGQILDSKQIHEIDSRERTELPHSSGGAVALTELPSPDESSELDGQDAIGLHGGRTSPHPYGIDVKS